MGAKKSEAVVASSELRRSTRKRKAVDYVEVNSLKIAAEDARVQKKKAAPSKPSAKKMKAIAPEITEERHEGAEYDEDDEAVVQKFSKKKVKPAMPKKAPAKKLKRVTKMDLAKDEDEDEPEQEAKMSSKQAGKKKTEAPVGEKRLKRYVNLFSISDYV